jgi:DTW domain-containing protein
MPVGTARMVGLSLSQSVIRPGIDFSGDSFVLDLISAPEPPYLLFPGPGSTDVADLPRDRPITLIVIDGTWAQARKLIKTNPSLLQLPRLAFAPNQPSAYQIRMQPEAHCVSTIEALAHVLGVLEGDPERFATLLEPFLAMVRTQVVFSKDVHAARHKRRRRNQARVRPTGPDDPLTLQTQYEHLVCVQGEANAWPIGHPSYVPPELLQWHAERPSTGERFTATLRLASPLADRVDVHLELEREVLREGISFPEFLAAWTAFLRPDDHLVVWGHYFAELARAAGVPLPAVRSDVRIAASRHLKRRPGTIERCTEALDLTIPAVEPGRCARRLAHLVAVTQFLRRG